MLSIHDTFKQFCKERHAEDKLLHNSKNFNLLQEVYANTELFDISLYDFEKNDNKVFKFKANPPQFEATTTDLKDFTLPFSSNFIKYSNDTYVFIREFSPDTITGTIYLTGYDTVFAPYIDEETGEPLEPLADELKEELAAKGYQEVTCGLITPLNCPFTISLNADTFTIKSNLFLKDEYGTEIPINESSKDDVTNLAREIFKIAFRTYAVINSLNKKSVVVDTPSTPQTEYYRRKHAETIKRYNRPIYYVLDKKEETKKVNYYKIQSRGHLEFTHSFKVRGHWRRISEKSYGKDRNGNYNILGYTWVTDYVKGNGELAQKLRVIK